MTSPIVVSIVGATDAWRQTADYVRQRLRSQFGPALEVRFYSLASSDMRQFPAALALINLGNAPLPLVFVDDDLFSMGSKVSLPALRAYLKTREEVVTE